LAVGSDPLVLKGDIHRITFWVVAVLAVLVAMYYFLVHRYMRKT
jgi:hypothetical protein